MESNFEKQVICEYKDRCKSYTPILNENTYTSKCFTCRNNTYVEPENLKEDYYKPNINTIIGELIMPITLTVVIVVFYLTIL